MRQKAYVTDIRDVDSEQVILLLKCSIQAYRAYSPKHPSRCSRTDVRPPKGFELVDEWSGVDAVFGHDRRVETYGLVFRSQSPPWHYIFAFRGTDSAPDMLDDCGVSPCQYTPFGTGSNVPSNVRVESGFFDIYRAGAGSVAPMQYQLFDLIDNYQASMRPVDTLYITGHSLGAALSQLFALDVALSRPAIPTVNINFASPRVGNKAFVQLYQQAVGKEHLRVQNIYDEVPRLPPTEMGFAHTLPTYLIAFRPALPFGKADLMACHSCLNYQTVINHAFEFPSSFNSTVKLTRPGMDYALRSERADAKNIVRADPDG